MSPGTEPKVQNLFGDLTFLVFPVTRVQIGEGVEGTLRPLPRQFCAWLWGSACVCGDVNSGISWRRGASCKVLLDVVLFQNKHIFTTRLTPYIPDLQQGLRIRLPRVYFRFIDDVPAGSEHRYF